MTNPPESENTAAFEQWHESYYGKGFNVMQNERDAWQAAEASVLAEYAPAIHQLQTMQDAIKNCGIDSQEICVEQGEEGQLVYKWHEEWSHHTDACLARIKSGER